MYMNAWDSGGGAVAVHRTRRQSQQGGTHAQLNDGMGYGEHARAMRDDTRRRLLRNMGTSADSIFYRPVAAAPAAADADAADADPTRYCTEYKSQFYAHYAESGPFVPRQMSYEVPAAALPPDPSALFGPAGEAAAPAEAESNPTMAASSVPDEPRPPAVDAAPTSKAKVPRVWTNGRPDKKNWNAKHQKQREKQLRRADVSSRDLPA